MTRILIAGRPRCGKTTVALDLAKKQRTKVLSIDSLMASKQWSEASEIASRWLDEPDPWIIEGVAAVRALRKWLQRHPKEGDGLPFDELRWYRRAKAPAPLKPGQVAMGKACETVWSEIKPEVIRRLETPAGSHARIHEEAAP